MIGHAILDLDGTLVDSAAVCTGIINAMLAARRSSRQVTVEQALPFVSLGGPRMVAALLGDDGGDPEREIVEFRQRYADDPTPLDSLYDGVREGLEDLRDRGVRLAVCSNKPQNLCDKVLSDLGLHDLFDAVVGGGPGIAPKPALDLLALTIARSGAVLERSCFVGDSELDHELARTAGLPFVFVTYGYSDPRWDFIDAWRCDRFHHVPDHVAAILRAHQPRTKVSMRH